MRFERQLLARAFRKLDTLRHVILRAGRLSRPECKLTLTMNGNAAVRDDVLRYVQAACAAYIYATLGGDSSPAWDWVDSACSSTWRSVARPHRAHGRRSRPTRHLPALEITSLRRTAAAAALQT